MWYSSSSGRIELQITLKQAEKGSHQGECDQDVEELMLEPSIKRQLDEIEPNLLIEELEEWGAWSEEELKIHKDNLLRLLWVACGDLREGDESWDGCGTIQGD